MSRVSDIMRKLMSPVATSGQQTKLYHLWSIGIFRGSSPLDMRSPADMANPVLRGEDVTDVTALFVADPFMIEHHGTWYMFFEVMNGRTRKGEIGLATSADGVHWKYQGIILRESFHLSYPYVFTWEGEYYIIPESHKAGQVRLYRAVKFPTEWKHQATLLDGGRFADTSVLWHDGLWWLFTETAPAFRFDTLRLYYSTALDGAWREHPGSPVVRKNPHVGRPAGRVLNVNGRLCRFAQDCFPHYGMKVRTLRISELNTRHYREEEIEANTALVGSGIGWNACGMHHLDAHRSPTGDWIGCVDGWTGVPLERYMEPIRNR